MCTYLRLPQKWKQADHPITCWKVMDVKRRYRRLWIKPLYYGIKYQKVGSVINAARKNIPDKVEEETYDQIYIMEEEAVHAYFKKKEAMDMFKFYSDGSDDGSENRSFALVKCEIPENTFYIEGSDDWVRGLHENVKLCGYKIICAKKIITKEIIQCAHI